MDFPTQLAYLLVYVAAFAAMISFLVFVHEWGHYAAARRIGVKATVFSIGMGPALWSRTDRNGCAWQIAALPIGGYVKFAGDGDGTSFSPASRGDTSPSPADRREQLHLRSPRAKAFVVAAGPAVNILLGLAIMTAIIYANGRPFTEPTVGVVADGSVAEQAGFLSGDRVIAVSGTRIESFEKLAEIVGLNPQRAFTFDVERNGEAIRLSATAASEVITVMGVEQTVGRIGVTSANERASIPVGLGESVVLGAQTIYSMTTSTLTGLWQIISGTRPVSDIGGPVRIAELSGNAAFLGLLPFLTLAAMISVNLGIVNLFPIPVLDGGHLLVCAWEAITKRPVNERVLANLSKAGGVFLLAVMIGLTMSDVTGITRKLFD